MSLYGLKAKLPTCPEDLLRSGTPSETQTCNRSPLSVCFQPSPRRLRCSRRVRTGELHGKAAAHPLLGLYLDGPLHPMSGLAGNG